MMCDNELNIESKMDADYLVSYANVGTDKTSTTVVQMEASKGEVKLSNHEIVSDKVNYTGIQNSEIPHSICGNDVENVSCSSKLTTNSLHMDCEKSIVDYEISKSNMNCEEKMDFEKSEANQSYEQHESGQNCKKSKVDDGEVIANTVLDTNIVKQSNILSTDGPTDVLKSFNSRKDATKGEPARKRGRPRKESAGTNTSISRDNIKFDSNSWDAVEPVTDPESVVRRSGRKRKQKRVLYVDLLDSNSKKGEKINNNELNDDGEEVGEQESSPLPLQTKRKSTPKARKKVGVRVLEKLSSQGEVEDRIEEECLEVGGDSFLLPPSQGKTKAKRKVTVRKKEKGPIREEVLDNQIRKETEWEVADDLQCQNCDMVYRTQQQFENHRLTCSAENPGVPIIPSRIIREPNIKATCPICYKYFSKRHGVKRHMTLKHTNLVHISCALCSKKIGDVEDNYRHFQNEHQHIFPQTKEIPAPGYLSCPVCTNPLQTRSLMKQHLVNMHANLIHVTCALCQRSVGTMLEYYQHFLRYHSHSSLTCDRNKEVVTTNFEKTSKENQNAESIDLFCNHCNKSLDTYKLLALHMLSHKINENTDIVGRKSGVQTSLLVNSTEFDLNHPSTSSLKEEPSDQFPLPVWWLPPETLNTLSSVSAVLGPDLHAALSRSLNVMTEMSTRLGSELQWTEEDYVCTKVDLVRRLNKVLQFSSGISDVGKCLLLVLEESQQFKGNPYVDNDNIAEEIDTPDVDDEDPISIDGNTGNNAEGDDDYGNGAAHSESDEALGMSFAANNSGGAPTSGYIPVGRVELQTPANPAVTGGSDNPGEMKEELENGRGDGDDVNGTEVPPEVAAATDRRSSLRIKPKGKKGKKTYVCKICGKQLSKKSGLVHHMFVHTEARPFKCKKCPATFKSEDRLKRHVQAHLKDDQYKCDFCDFSHRTLALVQKHNLEEHRDAPLFPCDLCKHKARTTHDLLVHKRVHEPRKCKLCDFEAKHLAELKSHERKNHANKFCSYCTYSCISNYQLQRHLKTHVKTETGQVFCCEICGATFDTNRKLEYHVVRHTNKTPYECAQCDYKCSSRQSYDAHMFKHSGLRPYKCNVCDADFYRSSYLKQHMRMHSDEKEFCCKFCGKGFKYRYNCQEHEMIHTGEKKFKCKLCKFACRRRKFLDQHMAEHRARGSDVEDLSGEEGGTFVADISGLVLRTDNLVQI